MKKRILALLLSLLLLCALPVQALAANMDLTAETVADADYDGIPDTYDSAPNSNSFSGTYKSGDFNAAISYTMDYRNFFGDNTVYNQDIADFSTWAAQLTYENDDGDTTYTPSVALRDSDGSSITKVTHIDQLMRAHGMENVIDYKLGDGYFDSDISMSAFSDDDMSEAYYGHHKVTYQGQTIEVIAVYVRGTNGTIQEWSSNFNVGNLYRFGQEYDAAEGKLRFPNADWMRKTNHRGFDVCANRFRKALSDYIEEFVDPDATPVFWISGHSRGGSISNILASYLVDEGEKVFAYTFASPNTTANTEASAAKYDCIFNLVNGDDFVPRLPMPEWGFTRYGRTATMFASTATSAQRSSYLGTTSYSYKSDSDLVSLCNKFVGMTENNDGGIDGWKDVYVFHCGHQHADEQSGEYRTGCIRKRSGLELSFNESMFNGWSQRVQRYAYWSSSESGICETPAYAMQVLAELMGNLSLSGGWDYLTTNKLADRYDFGKTSLISYATGITDPHYMENYYLIQKLIEEQGSPDSAYTNNTTLYTDGNHRPLHEHSYTFYYYDGMEPTCTQEGEGYKVCACSQLNADWYDDIVNNVKVPALGHDLQYAYLDNDTHSVSCSRCSEVSDTEACVYEDGVCIYCGHVKAPSIVSVYVVDELDGASVYAWAWGDAGNLDAAWPGHALTAEGVEKGGHNYYKLELSVADYDKLIFNRGGQPQTATLNIAADAGSNNYVIYYLYGVNGNDLLSSQGTDIWPAPGVVTAPTCTEPGYTTYTGLFTGASVTGNETPALGHTPGSPVTENDLPATCTAAGSYDNVVYCTVCGAELSRETVTVPANGHNWGAWTTNNDGTHRHTCTVCGEYENEACTYTDTVTEPTATEQGYTTHTCTVCGYSYADSYTGPLGSDYPVHFSVPAGVTQPADMISNSNTGITLPTVEGPEGYSFLGWVTEDYDNVETLPATILTGTYIAPQEITLKALFTYTEGSGGVAYELLTAAPADWTGNYVITNNSSSTKYVLKGVNGSADGTNAEVSGNCSTLAASGITLEDNLLTNVANDYIFTLDTRDSYYTVQSLSTGSYYGMNASSYLYAYSTLNTSYCGWTPAINASGAGQLKNAANGSYPYLGFSTSNNYFWSASSNNANVLQFWKETQLGTAYYTTIIEEEHVHTPGNTVVENVIEATCTNAGSYDEVVYCTDCGEELSRTHITVEALGHLPGEAVQENYVEPTATEYGGYDTVVYCQRCNAELSREHTVLEPTGTPEPELNEDLSFYTSISIGVEIKTTFTIRQNVLNGYASWYLEVSKLDDQGEPTETKRFGEGQEGAVTNVNNVAWRAVYTDITAKEMGVSFAATLHVFDANGQEYYSNTVTNTVKDYIVGELVKTDNENAVRTLCADMLNYGAAAQNYFVYDTDNLVNENLSAAAAAAKNQFETKTQAPATLVNGSNGPNLYGSVSIKNRVVLSITARNLGAEGTVQIQVKKQGSNEVKEVLETTKVGSVYSAKFSNVEANEMRDMFEFTALVDGVETGTPLLWSVEGYVRAARLNSDTSAEELALLNALLIYTDSAAAVMS